MQSGSPPRTGLFPAEDVFAKIQCRCARSVGAYNYGKCNVGGVVMGRPFLGDSDTTMQGVPPRGRPPLKKARTANALTHTAELRGQMLRKPTSERKDKRNGERRLWSRRPDTRRATAKYGSGTRLIRKSATNGRSRASATEPGCSM